MMTLSDEAIGRRASPPTARLERKVFATSRMSEFCTVKELTLQTGHPPEQWPLVIIKELVDNAIDEAEKSRVAPIISIEVRGTEITVTDNGPGIAAATIAKVLDFAVRASDKEAYVSPTRGAQGNALKTIIAMGFALDGARGETIIEAHGIKHSIVFEIDPIRLEPKVSHGQAASFVRSGTRIVVRWPECACSHLDAARGRFLQIASDFTYLNPHLTLRVDWNGKTELDAKAADATWAKWLPSDPIPAHWYTVERFERLIAAHIAHDQDNGGNMLIRDFVATFRGFSGSAKQKIVLAEIGVARTSLAAFFDEGRNREGVARLLAVMQRESKPVKPADLGLIGEDHLTRRFCEAGAQMRTFKYVKQVDVTDSLPWVAEIAFAWTPTADTRRLVTGVNFSPGINNPFRSLGRYGQSLDTILANQWADEDEPVMMVLHITCPRLTFTDKGKSTLSLGRYDGTEEQP
jgi:DNA topoisomerase VI subunit B